MPTIAAYVEIPENQLKRVAKHVLLWIKISKPKRTVGDFVDRYNLLKERMFPNEGIPHMHRWRVLAFTNLAQGRPSRNVRVPYCREISIIAAVVGTTVEAMLGLEDPGARVRLNVMEQSANAASLIQLMAKHQPHTKKLIAFADFIPCSLETPGFMHAHHEALFGDSGDVMIWDGIGNTRRSELLGTGEERTWEMIQINFLSDLRRIATGGREYAAIPAKLRKQCFEHLAELVDNPKLKIRLLIVDDTSDQEAAAIKCDLGGFDSVITWDTHLMIARDRLGINYYSEKPRHTYGWRGMMHELMAFAVYARREHVVKLLRSLANDVTTRDSGKLESKLLKRVS